MELFLLQVQVPYLQVEQPVLSICSCWMQTQEREAKENMKRKAQEIKRQRQDAMKYGRNASGYGGIGGGGSSNGGRQDIQIVESLSADNPKPSSYTAAVPSR